MDVVNVLHLLTSACLNSNSNSNSNANGSLWRGALASGLLLLLNFPQGFEGGEQHDSGCPHLEHARRNFWTRPLSGGVITCPVAADRVLSSARYAGSRCFRAHKPPSTAELAQISTSNSCCVHYKPASHAFDNCTGSNNLPQNPAKPCIFRYTRVA